MNNLTLNFSCLCIYKSVLSDCRGRITLWKMMQISYYSVCSYYPKCIIPFSGHSSSPTSPALGTTESGGWGYCSIFSWSSTWYRHSFSFLYLWSLVAEEMVNALNANFHSIFYFYELCIHTVSGFSYQIPLSIPAHAQAFPLLLW